MSFKKILAVVVMIFLSFLFLIKTPLHADEVGDALKGASCGYLNGACCQAQGKVHITIPVDWMPFPLNWVAKAIATPVDFVLNLAVSPLIGAVVDAFKGAVFDTGFGHSDVQCLQGKPIQRGNSCLCVDDRNAQLARLCLSIQSVGEQSQCATCMRNGDGIWTGLGCLYSDPPKFVQQNLLGLMVSFAALVAFICIIYAAIILQTSRGNPERVKKAREYLTNCILGLLLIIFSIFILRLIGVTILQIPGLS